MIRDARALDYADSLSHDIGYWGEHPKNSLADWQYEVSNGDTRQGYWDWVVSRLNATRAVEPRKPKPPVVESSSMTAYRVTWTIDLEAKSPRAAAEEIWRDSFGRTLPPAADQCCVFEVRKLQPALMDSEVVTVDLSEVDETDLEWPA